VERGKGKPKKRPRDQQRVASLFPIPLFPLPISPILAYYRLESTPNVVPEGASSIQDRKNASTTSCRAPFGAT
jgi:hypothetical protein